MLYDITDIKILKGTVLLYADDIVIISDETTLLKTAKSRYTGMLLYHQRNINKLAKPLFKSKTSSLTISFT